MSVLSTAGSRSAQGASVGGPWGAVIGAVIGLFEAKSDQHKRLDLLKTQMKLVDERNQSQLNEQARAYSEVAKQRTALTIKTQQAFAYYSAQAGTEKASVANDFAAADMIGTQKLIAQSNIDRQQDAAVAQTKLNLEISHDDLNTQVTNIEHTTLNNLVDAKQTAADLFPEMDVMADLLAIGQSYMDAKQGNFSNPQGGWGTKYRVDPNTGAATSQTSGGFQASSSQMQTMQGWFGQSNSAYSTKAGSGSNAEFRSQESSWGFGGSGNSNSNTLGIWSR